MIAGTKYSIIGLEARGNLEMEEIGEYVSSKKGETGTPDDQSWCSVVYLLAVQKEGVKLKGRDY